MQPENIAKYLVSNLVQPKKAVAPKSKIGTGISNMKSKAIISKVSAAPKASKPIPVYQSKPSKKKTVHKAIPSREPSVDSLLDFESIEKQMFNKSLIVSY